MSRIKKERSIIESPIFLLILMTVLVLIATVGYSALSSNLMISGEASIRVPADIRITNIKLLETTNEGYETYNSEYCKDGIKIFTTLPNIDSSVTYEVGVKSTSDLTYVLSEINTLINTNENMIYTIEEINKYEEIISRETKTFKITVKYKEDLIEVLENNLSVFEIEFKFIEKEEENPIIIVTEENGEITITALDEGSGLSEDNIYKYYLSTSALKPTNGEWKDYTSGESFNIEQVETLYLWIYPIRDKVGNVNDNKTFNEPYVIKSLYKIYTITYDLAGGTLNTANPSEYTKETETFTLNNPTRNGYTFKGWTGSNGETPSTNVSISKGSTANKSYTANWYKNLYTDGEIVYYDVLTGKKCTNYHIDNSLIGYNGTNERKTTENQNSCLKFYVFNDDTGDTVLNLLLDHDTTPTVFWTDTSTRYKDGPTQLINQLKSDTSSWVGTKTPTNYTFSGSFYGNYTIDYSTYKARLITVNEIAEITGNTGYEATMSYTKFFFDTNTSTASETCKEGNTSGCKYGWLYDRTSTTCTIFGCLNNSDYDAKQLSDYGYWTATATAFNPSNAWFVSNSGRLDDYGVNRNDNYGVRPVIEVYKSNLY